ncbi:hypothetical protein Tco_1312958 [Tanacetum coccineum]
MQKEKEQQDKLNAVKVRLLYGDESERNPRNPRNHEESHYSESKTPTAQTELRMRQRNNEPSFNTVPADSHGHPAKIVVVFHRLGEKNQTASCLHSDSRHSRVTAYAKTPRCNQGSIITGAHRPEEPADIQRVKTARELLQKHERWVNATCAKSYNSKNSSAFRLGNAKASVRANSQKKPLTSYERSKSSIQGKLSPANKHIKDPVEIHHIKQRDGESTEDFMERYKAEVLDVEGAPECMKISRFMHMITPPLPEIDQLYCGKSSHSVIVEKKHPRRGGKQRSDRNPDRFSLLTKTPKEIFALEKGKFKAPPPMVTPAEKRDLNKYYEFHADTGHSTNECMQLGKQIEEMIKSGDRIGKARVSSLADTLFKCFSGRLKGYRMTKAKF